MDAPGFQAAHRRSLLADQCRLFENPEGPGEARIRAWEVPRNPDGHARPWLNDGGCQPPDWKNLGWARPAQGMG
jgi:hypothetical protein